MTTQKLLEAQRLNVLEQPIIYLTQKPAEVTSAFSVLHPGEETGWHKHMVPTHAYLMEGTSTIEFEVDGDITDTLLSQRERRGWVLLMYGTMLLTKLTSLPSFL